MAADPLSLRVPAAMLNVRRQFYSQRVLEPDSPAYKASSDCEEFPEPVPIETIAVRRRPHGQRMEREFEQKSAAPDEN